MCFAAKEKVEAIGEDALPSTFQQEINLKLKNISVEKNQDVLIYFNGKLLTREQLVEKKSAQKPMFYCELHFSQKESVTKFKDVKYDIEMLDSMAIRSANASDYIAGFHANSKAKNPFDFDLYRDEGGFKAVICTHWRSGRYREDYDKEVTLEDLHKAFKKKVTFEFRPEQKTLRGPARRDGI